MSTVPDTTRAEISFPTHDEPFSVLLSPVPLREYLAFRRDWATPGSVEEFEASIDRFASIAEASCGCGRELADHDVNTVRALATFWIGRVMEVEPPLPVESSSRTASAAEGSTPTGRASSRRRS